MPTLLSLLQASAARHSHLCPRQVLGVRSALAGAGYLGLGFPRRDKRLLAILETDGCYADGIEVVTGATVGHRTLRIEDFGKIAVTLIDVKNRRSIRIAPQVDVRERAWGYAPGERRAYFAQLGAYQIMPENELFTIQEVQLLTSVEAIISRAGLRADCHGCGEEIVNQREIRRNGLTLCRACAGQGYYSASDHSRPVSDRSAS
ncbi:MAG: formylmethanofuran dehydrogenase [Chloroflexi bacterium RBG_16_54_18]|nr:MAG: formylmethanofuran dehydrogenase [Chloroflexi bacterium RBG_16_54_18]